MDRSNSSRMARITTSSAASVGTEHSIVIARIFIQFLMAIRINTVNHYRNYLKVIRRAAADRSESARDVFEVESVRQTLLLNFFNQLALKLLRCHGLGSNY